MKATHSLHSDQPKPRPRLIYYIHVAVAVISLPVFAFSWGDLALHPTQITPGFGVGIGLIIGLGISLLTLVVGILCLRRSPRNSIGAILIMWGVLNVGIVHPRDDLAWISAFGNLT